MAHGNAYTPFLPIPEMVVLAPKDPPVRAWIKLMLLIGSTTIELPVSWFSRVTVNDAKPVEQPVAGGERVILGGVVVLGVSGGTPRNGGWWLMSRLASPDPVLGELQKKLGFMHRVAISEENIGQSVISIPFGPPAVKALNMDR
jgi:hypothetical protein